MSSARVYEKRRTRLCPPGVRVCVTRAPMKARGVKGVQGTWQRSESVWKMGRQPKRWLRGSGFSPWSFNALCGSATVAASGCEAELWGPHAFAIRVLPYRLLSSVCFVAERRLSCSEGLLSLFSGVPLPWGKVTVEQKRVVRVYVGYISQGYRQYGDEWTGKWQRQARDRFWER